MSTPPPAIESRRYLSPDSKVGLTVSNLLALIGMVAAGVIAWQKIPSTEDVKSITTESIRQVTIASEKRDVEFDRRLRLQEENTAVMNKELAKMNKQMSYLLIIMASAAADDMQQSTRARSTADKVRRNLRAGGDPLEGLPWSD